MDVCGFSSAYQFSERTVYTYLIVDEVPQTSGLVLVVDDIPVTIIGEHHTEGSQDFLYHLVDCGGLVRLVPEVGHLYLEVEESVRTVVHASVGHRTFNRQNVDRQHHIGQGRTYQFPVCDYLGFFQESVYGDVLQDGHWVYCCHLHAVQVERQFLREGVWHLVSFPYYMVCIDHLVLKVEGRWCHYPDIGFAIRG